MGRKAVNKVPAFVDALVEVGVRRLQRLPACKPDEAHEVMGDIAAEICHIYAKSQMYVPANLEGERQKRDALIREQYAVDGPTGAGKFSAERLQEVARDYGLTTAHAYVIVRSSTAKARPAPTLGVTPPPPGGHAWPGRVRPAIFDDELR